MLNFLKQNISVNNLVLQSPYTQIHHKTPTGNQCNLSNIEDINNKTLQANIFHKNKPKVKSTTAVTTSKKTLEGGGWYNLRPAPLRENNKFIRGCWHPRSLLE